MGWWNGKIFSCYSKHSYHLQVSRYVIKFFSKEISSCLADKILSTHWKLDHATILWYHILSEPWIKYNLVPKMHLIIREIRFLNQIFTVIYGKIHVYDMYFSSVNWIILVRILTLIRCGKSVDKLKRWFHLFTSVLEADKATWKMITFHYLELHIINVERFEMLIQLSKWSQYLFFMFSFTIN